MKTYNVSESVEAINFWFSLVGLPVKSESFFNSWGLAVGGDLLSDIKIWAFDYISEQHSIMCEK